MVTLGVAVVTLGTLVLVHVHCGGHGKAQDFTPEVDTTGDMNGMSTEV